MMLKYICFPWIVPAWCLLDLQRLGSPDQIREEMDNEGLKKADSSIHQLSGRSFQQQSTGIWLLSNYSSALATCLHHYLLLLQNKGL